MDMLVYIMKWSVVNYHLTDDLARRNFITKISKPGHELNEYDAEILKCLLKNNNTTYGGEVR